MERFVLFFRGGTADKRSERWAQWIETLKQTGILLDSSPLINDGKIVSENGGAVRDFTFNVNEHARGFAVIQAKDLDEAVFLSKNCPVFDEGGNVTVRPMKDSY